MSANRVFEEVVLVTSSILLISLYPILLPLVLLLATYRLIIEKVVKWDPKVGRMVTGVDANVFGKDPYGNPLAVLAPMFLFNAVIDKHQVMSVFTDKIIKPRNKNYKSVFPEMMQKLVKKYGYFFWYSDEKFKLENHIQYINEDDPDKPMTRQELTDYVQSNLVERPFNPNQSPWNILIVRHIIDPDDPVAKSAMVLLFHHGLFDGFSIINFMQRVAVNPWKEVAGVKEVPKPGLLTNLVQILAVLLTGPYHILKLRFFLTDKNEFMQNMTTDYKSIFNYKISNLIKGSDLKEIRNHFKVSLAATLLTVAAESIKKYLDQKELLIKAHISTLLPVPHHPNYLTNHWTFGKMPIIIYNGSPVKTLKAIDAEYKKLISSTLPITVWYISKVTGMLPVPLMVDSVTLFRNTLVVTNFPGPTRSVDMFGYKITDISISAKPSPASLFSMAVLSYRDQFRFSIGADASVFRKREDAIAVVNTLYKVLNECRFLVEKSKD